jgi:putative transposase
MDASPAHIWATLLDEGVYLCAVRTMYRILSASKESNERRRVVQHQSYAKPELLATAPNQVWSWDITQLRGPVKWSYFYLYVLLDIFSRYVVGWLIAETQSGSLAKRLIEESLRKQNIQKDHKLIIHNDRGSPMKSKPVAHLMADLGITQSWNRPHVSNDNPFSEAHFKTLKYSPHFPDRFGSCQDATGFSRFFFPWYNTEHKHSSLGYHTPKDVHYGKAQRVRELRQQTLDQAFLQHAERFTKQRPMAPSLPKAVWINPPRPIHDNPSKRTHDDSLQDQSNPHISSTCWPLQPEAEKAPFPKMAPPPKVSDVTADTLRPTPTPIHRKEVLH